MSAYRNLLKNEFISPPIVSKYSRDIIYVAYVYYSIDSHDSGVYERLNIYLFGKSNTRRQFSNNNDANFLSTLISICCFRLILKNFV